MSYSITANITSNLDDNFTLDVNILINDSPYEVNGDELEAIAICAVLDTGIITLESDSSGECQISCPSKNFWCDYTLPLNKDMLIKLEDDDALADFALEEALHCGYLKITVK